MSSAVSESYDDESEESESEISESSSSSEELETSILDLNNESTDYFFTMDTQHKDFVRSMVQFGDNILITASEDKTMKVFYF